MSDQSGPRVGTVGWMDLTVEDATRVRDFYREVVGLDSSEVDMGDYSDYSLLEPATGRAVAGVCHSRGENAAIPSVWLIYFTVADLGASIARSEALGGQVVGEPRNVGAAGFCVMRDPSGAVFALFQPPPSP